MSTRRQTLLGSFVILSVACNALSGASDLASSSSDPALDGSDTGSAREEGGAISSDGGPLLKDVHVEVVDACGSEARCFDLPSGFTLVAFGNPTGPAGADPSCPNGFSEARTTVENPVVGANACACGCTITTQPTCPLNGAIGNLFSRNNSLACDMTGTTYANNGCGTEGLASAFSPGDAHRFTPPGPTGGQCAPMGTADTNTLTTVRGRMCQATTLPSCGGKICPAALLSPFQACVATAGDVTCPSTFPTKHVIGSSASFTCSSNGCGCSVTARCSGRLFYYTSSDCSGNAIFDIIADDTCRPTSYPAYASHNYVPNAPSNVVCTRNGSSTPSAPTLVSPTTVCCN